MSKIIQLKASCAEGLFDMIEDYWNQGYDILGIPWYKTKWFSTSWYCRMIKQNEAIKLNLKIGPITKQEK